MTTMVEFNHGLPKILNTNIPYVQHTYNHIVHNVMATLPFEVNLQSMLKEPLATTNHIPNKNDERRRSCTWKSNQVQ